MKFTKKNLFAIGTTVMMTASLATFASAATPGATGAPIDGDANSFEVMDVDLSTMDFSQMLEGTPIAAIDFESVPCTLSSPALKGGEASGSGAEVMDVNLDELDFSRMLEGTPSTDGQK